MIRVGATCAQYVTSKRTETRAQFDPIKTIVYAVYSMFLSPSLRLVCKFINIPEGTVRSERSVYVEIAGKLSPLTLEKALYRSQFSPCPSLSLASYRNLARSERFIKHKRLHNPRLTLSSLTTRTIA